MQYIYSETKIQLQLIIETKKKKGVRHPKPSPNYAKYEKHYSYRHLFHFDVVLWLAVEESKNTREYSHSDACRHQLGS